MCLPRLVEAVPRGSRALLQILTAVSLDMFHSDYQEFLVVKIIYFSSSETPDVVDDLSIVAGISLNHSPQAGC